VDERWCGCAKAPRASQSRKDGAAFAVEALAQAGTIIHIENSAHGALDKRFVRVSQAPRASLGLTIGANWQTRTGNPHPVVEI